MNKNITNAYVVLSISTIEAMLAAAKLEQRFRNNYRDSVCIVLEGLTVNNDSADEPQIASWSISAAVSKFAQGVQEDIDEVKGRAIEREMIERHGDVL